MNLFKKREHVIYLDGSIAEEHLSFLSSEYTLYSDLIKSYTRKKSGTLEIVFESRSDILCFGERFGMWFQSKIGNNLKNGK